MWAWTMLAISTAFARRVHSGSISVRQGWYGTRNQGRVWDRAILRLWAVRLLAVSAAAADARYHGRLCRRAPLDAERMSAPARRVRNARRTRAADLYRHVDGSTEATRHVFPK